MSTAETDHFTDMDGKAIGTPPEPLPCPFCGSAGDQRVIERWSEEEHADAVLPRRMAPVRRQRSPGCHAAQGWNGRKGYRQAEPCARRDRTERRAESGGLTNMPGVLDNQNDPLRRDTSPL
jgi:hypothetical protein